LAFPHSFHRRRLRKWQWTWTSRDGSHWIPMETGTVDSGSKRWVAENLQRLRTTQPSQGPWRTPITTQSSACCSCGALWPWTFSFLVSMQRFPHYQPEPSTWVSLRHDMVHVLHLYFLSICSVWCPLCSRSAEER
jgi:hypothetical protein